MLNAQKWLMLVFCLASITCKQNVVSPADLLSDPSIKPAVIYTYPAVNSTGPYDNFSTTITVRFNKLMDLTSLRHAVRFSSLLGDIKEDTGRASSQSGEVASVSPVITNSNSRFLWKIGQTYTLRIDNSAKDVNGNYLVPPFSMTIKPEPYFRVKSMYPSSGSGIVSPGSQIQLQFNSLVDTTIFSSITITPALAGRWRYASLNRVGVDSSSIIYQGGGMRPGTNYSVSVGSGARDKSGNTMPDGFASSFTTENFLVYYTRPSDGDTTASSFASVQVVFNAEIDTGSVRGAFVINPSLEGLFGFEGSTGSFSFSPILSFVAGTKYTVTIASSMMSKTGAPLASPYEFSFTIMPFKVLWTRPWDGMTHVSRNYPIIVETSDLLDTSSIRNAFNISPPVSGTFSYNDQDSYFHFFPSVPMDSLSVYTVTIANTLRSKDGVILSSPYRFSFATGY